ncbi:MAG: helix-turn-helix transcriptional regulator [Firmicutes bacterium]|nr:helix-turn-helix transcriptional regulator [Bacillota bacterium]
MNQLLIKELGVRIQNQRTAHHMTQEQLAERAGLHPVYISAVERGVKCPTLTTLERITKALDITFSELFSGIESYEEPTGSMNEIGRLFSSLSHAEQQFAVSLLRDILL